MKYQDNNNLITVAQIERALTEKYGDSDYDREAGCSCDGEWLSIEEVLSCIIEHAGY
jgi:hypothetical protein